MQFELVFVVLFDFMGNQESIIEVDSHCDWVPDYQVIDQVMKIESFNSSYDVETQLFDNLAQRISNIDGVSNVVIENPRKRWFRRRKINVSILPPENKFNIKGTATSDPYIGIKGAIQYINGKNTTNFGTIIYPSEKGHSLFLQQKFPILSRINLERSNPVPHFALSYKFSYYPFYDIQSKMHHFDFTLSPANNAYKASFFVHFNKFSDFNVIPHYLAYGFRAKQVLTKDSTIVKDNEKQLALKIKHAASAFYVFNVYDEIIPALKYTVHLAGKMPPNVILRADAGTILSPEVLPLSELFVLGGNQTLRCIKPQSFSNTYGKTKVGCEHYLTLGCDMKIPLIPQQKIDLLLFANLGFGWKLNPSLIDLNSYDRVPSLVHAAALGFGITLTEWKVNFETTFSIPIDHSYGLETTKYLITLTKNDL